jgi:polyferredoxin
MPSPKDEGQLQRQPDPHPQLHRFVPHLRMSGAGFLFLLFFGTVWLNWGGRQAVLWDLAESKFHIFGATFWPQVSSCFRRC